MSRDNHCPCVKPNEIFELDVHRPWFKNLYLSIWISLTLWYTCHSECYLNNFLCSVFLLLKTRICFFACLTKRRQKNKVIIYKIIVLSYFKQKGNSLIPLHYLASLQWPVAVNKANWSGKGLYFGNIFIMQPCSKLLKNLQPKSREVVMQLLFHN